MPTVVSRSRVIPLMLVLLSACGPYIGSMRVTPLPLEPRPATHPIRLYFSAQPRCAFEEIAVIRAEETSFMMDDLQSDHTAEQLRSRARKLGGDAIVGLVEVIEDNGIIRTETVSRSRTSDSTSSKSSTEYKTAVAPDRTRRLEGRVVRFSQPDCRE